MNIRFLLLTGEGHPSPLCEQDLQTIGMQCRFSSAYSRLFLTPDTPTLSVPGRGMIVGKIFTQEGRAVTDACSLGNFSGRLDDHLLHHYWGEYVALLIDRDNPHELIILRDPSGGVPCVYALRNGHGFVTSDVSLAVELGLYRRQVDWNSIAHGLHFPYRRTERTALLGVHELLPGCALNLSRSGASVSVAWSPWNFVARNIRHNDPHAATDEVHKAVSTVVNAMATSDRRIIVQLSGGLDSSIIASCLRDTAANPMFCSLVMPVDGTDERPYARLVTDMLGHELVSVPVGFENVRIDFPTPPSSVVPAMGILHHATSKAWDEIGTANGISTFYTGGGGDSVFCYLKTAAPAADAFRERGITGAIPTISHLSVLHQCTLWKAGRLTLKKLTRKSPLSWKVDRSLLSLDVRAMAEQPHPWVNAPSRALPGDREKINDLVGTQLYAHATQGPNRCVRRPLLSQPVMEACLKVPTWMWIADGRNRAIARDAFADILPDGIFARRSKGSYSGYIATAYDRNKVQIREFLLEGKLRANGLLDPVALSKFFASDFAPRDLSYTRAFDLCTAENWARNQAHKVG